MGKIDKFAKEYMGKQVSFTQIYEKFRTSYEENKITKNCVEWKIKECDPIYGWCTGTRWVQTGYSGGYFGCTMPDYEWEPFFMETEKRKEVYLITPYPTQKPIYGVPTSVHVLKEVIKIWSIDEATQEFLSKSSIDYPRNTKGRFIRR